MDGSGAGSSWYPCLQLVDPGGHVMFDAVSPNVVAAGASADVSWFPHVGLTAAQAATIPVTEAFMVDTRVSTGAQSTTVLANGVNYLVSVQGTYSLWNAALGVGTPEPDAQYPTSGGEVRVSTQVGLDAECCFAAQSPLTPPPAIGHVNYMKFDLGGGAGFTHVEPYDGSHSTPVSDHFYTYNLTGTGHVLKCKMDDPGGAGLYHDNYGNFLVTIYAIPGSGGGGAGTISDITSTGGTITVTAPTGPTTNVDLPNSGVAGGTYGDASHVSQVTVSAEGIVTAASSIAISGLSGSGLVLLFDSTLGGAAASIDTGAGGVSTAYNQLFIFIVARTGQAAVQSGAWFTLNNDTGNNYTRQFMNGNATVGSFGSNTSVAPSTGAAFNVLGANATANAAASVVVHIPNYSGTTFSKQAICHVSSVENTNAVTSQTAFMWNNTAAISRIALSGTGNLQAGTRMTIYGT